jgi:predicted glycoside hydrolase/deacetylase ChbG (UPF0249 family)
VSVALIVNADDFGLSEGTNEGIVEAHERGIVTSSSLMVHGPAASEAGSYAATHPALAVGLHLDLGEWVYRDGAWREVYQRGPAAEELARQLDRFRALVGRDPTHLDSHQHVHEEEPVRSLLAQVGVDLGVAVRGLGGVQYCGAFHGQSGRGEPYPEGIAVENLIDVLGGLAAGVVELGCHPGRDRELASPYRLERLTELEVLCDPRVRAAIDAAGIALVPHGRLSP